MLKIIIFFIFSLIMLKISWPDIETVPQPLSVLASDSRGRGNLYIFQRFMTLLRSLYSRAMTLLHILISDTHGRKFYRFFALEFLFLLILVNFGYWLRNPFTIFRMITWMILCSSFLLAGYGIYHLLEYGKPQIIDNPEATTDQATSGIYKYIRYPLYSSMIILGAVTLIKNPSLLATSLFSVGTVFLHATARIEEKENLLKFGEDYAEYMTRSSMFFSFLF